MSTKPHVWEFHALTKVWTGNINGKPNRLITTGLLGSIRWWFEVVVRGLGGAPCDPSNTKCIDREHCVACELFGCTGWARKFRLDVLGANGAVLRRQITKGQTFKLRFTPLRAIAPEEWALLNLTLRLIAEHGAIGGKTVFKPTDEHTRRNELHHQDFGIIELIKAPDGATSTNRTALEAYARHSRWHNARQNGFAWASLTNFWSVPGKYLTRQNADKSTFNRVLGRNESKVCRDCGSPHDPRQKCPRATPDRKGRVPAPHRRSEAMKSGATSSDRWLAGDQRVSKKVFSFKSPARTYGFINPLGKHESITLDEIKTRLGEAWQRTIVEEEVAEGDETRIQLLNGDMILDRLLRAPKETS